MGIVNESVEFEIELKKSDKNKLLDLVRYMYHV